MVAFISQLPIVLFSRAISITVVRRVPLVFLVLHRLLCQAPTLAVFRHKRKVVVMISLLASLILLQVRSSVLSLSCVPIGFCMLLSIWNSRLDPSIARTGAADYCYLMGGASAESALAITVDPRSNLYTIGSFLF
jgi:hypothetical protein